MARENLALQNTGCALELSFLFDAEDASINSWQVVDTMIIFDLNVKGYVCLLC